MRRSMILWAVVLATAAASGPAAALPPDHKEQMQKGETARQQGRWQRRD